VRQYRTIVADPPWQIQRLGALSWREGRPSGAGMELDYLTMTDAEIAALPVSNLASANAHLFMWTTQRHLPAALDIVKAWGFRYICALAWCKEPHGWGPGGAFQSTLEHCLYATRGTVGRMPQVDRQWWVWPRGAHSAKPEAFLDMVEAHFPEPRLEMFARRQRLGWDTWGDQAIEHVEVVA
jgi:N6-adenosine-specific RNA methylase IME4